MNKKVWKIYLHTKILIIPCFNILLINILHFVSKFQHLWLLYGLKSGTMSEWLLNHLDLKTNICILVTKSEHKQITFGTGEKQGLEVGIRQKSTLMLPVLNHSLWLQNPNRGGCSFLHIKHCSFFLWKCATCYGEYQLFCSKGCIFYKFFINLRYVFFILGPSLCSLVIVCLWNTSWSPFFLCIGFSSLLA